jgi:hypothetical protein
MNPMKTVAAMIAILWVPIILPAQDKKPANLAAAPPNVAMFVHQEFFLGKAADRQKLESTISRACDRVDVPRYWIDLESISGEPEALVFSSYDSYEEMEQSDIDWRRFLIMHPDLERTKEEVEALAASERRTIAVRRDDLGYLSENIDLSEARFIHILEVRLFPGHEGDFAQAYRILADAYARIQADNPWVVYEIDAGAPAPTFLVLRPMSELKQQDDELSRNQSLIEAEGEQGIETLTRITREAYAGTVSTIYAVDPEMSHISKAFAVTDPDFWIHRAVNAKPELKHETPSGAERLKK